MRTLPKSLGSGKKRGLLSMLQIGMPTIPRNGVKAMTGTGTHEAVGKGTGFASGEDNKSTVQGNSVLEVIAHHLAPFGTLDPATLAALAVLVAQVWGNN